MKASRVYFLFLFLSAYTIANAQQNELTPDQNPRYKESLQRYMASADSLVKTQGNTLQQTYKAYDWYEARMERRQQRREWRHQENLNGNYYNGGWGYYNPYSWRSSFWFMPSVDYRWGRSNWRWR